MSIFVFDAYGTLFDVHAAIARHRAATGPDADRLSEIWRAKQLEYTWTLTLAGRYVDFWTLTERALDFALARVPSADARLKPRVSRSLSDARRLSGCTRRAARTQIARPAHRDPVERHACHVGRRSRRRASSRQSLTPSFRSTRFASTSRVPRSTSSHAISSVSSRRILSLSPPTVGTSWAPTRSAFERCGSIGHGCRMSTESPPAR